MMPAMVNSTASVPVRASSPETRGPDHLDAPVVVVLGAERRADLLDDRLLRLLAARLRGDADQHRRIVADALDLHVAEVEPVERCRGSPAMSAGRSGGPGPR